jgi:hypothetical protein
VQLLTDGRDIYARTATGAFFNLLKTPTQPLLVIGNEGLLKELSGKVKEKRKKAKPKKAKGDPDLSESERSSPGRPPAAE